MGHPGEHDPDLRAHVPLPLLAGGIRGDGYRARVQHRRRLRRALPRPRGRGRVGRRGVLDAPLTQRTRSAIVMFVFRRREIGQPFLAASAAAWTFASSAPGTLAATSRWIDVTAHPASVFSKFALAVVSMLSGVSPALPSSPENAIEKQPAWAAATSSSGFVPGASSNRIAKEYERFRRAPLFVERVPRPSFSPPFQVASAPRFMISLGAPKRPRLLTFPFRLRPSHAARPVVLRRLVEGAVHELVRALQAAGEAGPGLGRDARERRRPLSRPSVERR